MSDDVKVALIAGAVSVGLWLLSFLFEPFKERITSYFKLNVEHRYNEKKKIKEIISKNKMQILYAAEELNYRIWNLYHNYKKCWSRWDGRIENQTADYYFYSFIYRLSVFYGWAHKIESEMTFIDIKYADKSDLEFIKYLRLFFKLPCNARLISQFDNNYTDSVAVDHFFYNALKEFCYSLNKFNFQDESLFKEFSSSHEIIFSRFINEINPTEDRYRWDMLQLLHFVLMSFLNTYGYDYQRTSGSKINDIFNQDYTKTLLWGNFIGHIVDFKMDRQKSLKELIKMMKRRLKDEHIVTKRNIFPWNMQ